MNGQDPRGAGGDELFEGEFAEVDRVFRSSNEIDELTEFGLESGLRAWMRCRSVNLGNEKRDENSAHLVEQFDQVNVILLLTEVFLEKVVDGSFEHERVVDGDVSDAFLENVELDSVSIDTGVRRDVLTTRYQQG